MFKNSEMILQAILNAPWDQDAYRAYADALMEEGEQEKGDFIFANLGKRFLAEWPTGSLPVKWPFPLCDIPSTLFYHCKFVVENGFITGARMQLVDFIRGYHFLFKRQPIQSVLITDRTPWFNGDRAYWEGSISPGFSYLGSQYFSLPGEITAHFPPESKVRSAPPEGGIQVEPVLFIPRYRFKNTEEGLQALSVACVKLGRKENALLPLSENAYVQLATIGI